MRVHYLRPRIIFLALMVAICALMLIPFWGVGHAQKRQFTHKDCLDCHTTFIEKYFSMTHVHQPVKEKKCEQCHLRHGLTTVVALKADVNELCLSCHEKEKIGLTKPTIHVPLQKEKCTICHNPHASQSNHLLAAEGDKVCNKCHSEVDFKKQVVHKVMLTQGCMACHLAHGSDEKHLLRKAEVPLCM